MLGRVIRGDQENRRARVRVVMWRSGVEINDRRHSSHVRQFLRRFRSASILSCFKKSKNNFALGGVEPVAMLTHYYCFQRKRCSRSIIQVFTHGRTHLQIIQKSKNKKGSCVESNPLLRQTRCGCMTYRIAQSFDHCCIYLFRAAKCIKSVSYKAIHFVAV